MVGKFENVRIASKLCKCLQNVVFQAQQMKLCNFFIQIRSDRDFCSVVYRSGLTMVVIHRILWSKCPKGSIVEN